MPDREKIIKGLQIERECVSRDCDRDCGKCDLVQERDWLLSVYDDALALLKEQEAKPMTEYDDGWDCPRCGLKLVGKTASGYPCNELDLPDDEIVKYCPVCGQAVKWNDI